MIVNMNILVDSASPVSFLNAKRVTRAEIKIHEFENPYCG